MYDKIKNFFKCLFGNHDWKYYKSNKDKRTLSRDLMRRCPSCGRIEKKIVTNFGKEFAARWVKHN